MDGAVNTCDVLYKSLPGVMPLEVQPAVIHIMGYRALREASSHAGQLIPALLKGAASVHQHGQYAVVSRAAHYAYDAQVLAH